MPLVSMVDPADVDPTVRATVESGSAQYGQVLNTWRALLHRPSIFEAYLPYLRAVVGPGTVSARHKDLAALTVAIANHCRYSASHRVRSARAAGITDAELDAIAEGRTDPFDDDDQLVIELARELTLVPSTLGYDERPAAIGDELLDRLRSRFGEPQVVELLCVVSLWNALTRFHRVMDLPLDMPPPPPSIDRALGHRPANAPSAATTPRSS